MCVCVCERERVIELLKEKIMGGINGLVHFTTKLDGIMAYECIS